MFFLFLKNYFNHVAKHFFNQRLNLFSREIVEAFLIRIKEEIIVQVPLPYKITCADKERD